MNSETTIDSQTFCELKDLMGVDFVKELIDTYVADTADLIAQLRAALADHDASAFGRLAHSIKSSSASLGALAFAHRARELEMLGKAGTVSGSEPMLAQLETEFVQVTRRLEELRDAS